MKEVVIRSVPGHKNLRFLEADRRHVYKAKKLRFGDHGAVFLDEEGRMRCLMNRSAVHVARSRNARPWVEAARALGKITKTAYDACMKAYAKRDKEAEDGEAAFDVLKSLDALGMKKRLTADVLLDLEKMVKAW